jgi:hypothetical protein
MNILKKAFTTGKTDQDWDRDLKLLFRQKKLAEEIQEEMQMEFLDYKDSIFYFKKEIK